MNLQTLIKAGGPGSGCKQSITADTARSGLVNVGNAQAARTHSTSLRASCDAPYPVGRAVLCTLIRGHGIIIACRLSLLDEFGATCDFRKYEGGIYGCADGCAGADHRR